MCQSSLIVGSIVVSSLLILMTHTILIQGAPPGTPLENKPFLLTEEDANGIGGGDLDDMAGQYTKDIPQFEDLDERFFFNLGGNNGGGGGKNNTFFWPNFG